MFLDSARTVFADKVGIKKKTVNIDLEVYVSCQSTKLASIYTISYDKQALTVTTDDSKDLSTYA